jgi:hypothetical protein
MHMARTDKTAGQQIGRSHAEPTVQSRTAALEAQLAGLRKLETVLAAIRDLKRKHPRLVEEFGQQLHAAIDEEPSEEVLANEEVSVREEAEPGEEEYGVEKLMAWFRSRNNAPATIQEMAKGIDRSEKTIKSILYLRHKGKFVATERRGRNNRGYYRMAESTEAP